jgi:hypothetical protein
MFIFEIVAAKEEGILEPVGENWPFRDMREGQMVRYPMGTPEEIALAKKAQKYSKSYGKGVKKKYKTRTANIDGKKHMYIKRAEDLPA